MTTNATALALTFLIASSTVLVSAQDTLACSYKVDFPLGVKAEDIVRQHFDSLKLSYNIRVASNTQFANFVSFTINNGCGKLEASSLFYSKLTSHQTTQPKSPRFHKQHSSIKSKLFLGQGPLIHR
ncbi:hypothetical protein BDR26DRAFT_876743 [Obelidium mucronatum]|nr:hypothetical protein BDR26DRAFT_876743 [Obelidium mucronatum]